MKLSSLDGAQDFVLLGPGFGADGRWQLVTDLRPLPLPGEARGGEDEGAGRVWYAAYETAGASALCLSGHVEAIALDLDVEAAPLRCALDTSGYLAGVEHVRQRIAAGDVYQANLTLRAKVQCASGAALLASLCRRGVPRFAAWLKVRGVTELVSASPELLCAVEGRRLRAEPMKGTAAAGQRAWLEASAKDAAELAMITDLLRDDLNHLCERRSVTVPAARRYLELPYVVQAVSDVVGTLREGVGLRDVLAQLHPGGSVTGAPRPAAMELIRALEPAPRGAYCGTLGLQAGDGARFSLLIRTAERAGPGTWTWGAGGGITWDSDPLAELEELRLKLGALG